MHEPPAPSLITGFGSCDNYPATGGYFMGNKRNMKKISTALVGFGYSGKTFHAPILNYLPNISLNYIVSSNEKAVKNSYSETQLVSEFEDVIHINSVELIVLATPNKTHFEFAKKALEMGKNVVVDKPFVITTQEGKELIEIANKKQLVLSVFHNRRWDNDFLTIQSLLGSNKLGKVFLYESHYDRYRPEVQDRWREKDLPGSGILYDLGSHLIDQVVFLFGRPESIIADLEKQRNNAKAVDYFHLILKYQKQRVIIHGSCIAINNSLRYIVHGEKASFIKSGLDPQEDALKVGRLPDESNWGKDKPEFYGVLDTMNNNQPISEKLETIPGCYQNFYDGIAKAIIDRTASPVTAEEALTVIEIIEAAILSNKEKRSITL